MCCCQGWIFVVKHMRCGKVVLSSKVETLRTVGRCLRGWRGRGPSGRRQKVQSPSGPLSTLPSKTEPPSSLPAPEDCEVKQNNEYESSTYVTQTRVINHHIVNYHKCGTMLKSMQEQWPAWKCRLSSLFLRCPRGHVHTRRGAGHAELSKQRLTNYHLVKRKHS